MQKKEYKEIMNSENNCLYAGIGEIAHVLVII